MSQAGRLDPSLHLERLLAEEGVSFTRVEWPRANEVVAELARDAKTGRVSLAVVRIGSDVEVYGKTVRVGGGYAVKVDAYTKARVKEEMEQRGYRYHRGLWVKSAGAPAESIALSKAKILASAVKELLGVFDVVAVYVNSDVFIAWR